MSLPLCTTCGHNHEQGVKCSICGHVGKSQIYSKMRAKGNEKRCLNYKVHNPNNGTLNKIELNLLSELRSVSFEDNDALDNSCVHLFLFKGDSLLGSIRFRLQNDIIFLEKALIHPYYRNQKYGWSLLYFTMSYIISINCSEDLCISCNNISWLIEKCSAMQLVQHDVDKSYFLLPKHQILPLSNYLKLKSNIL